MQNTDPYSKCTHTAPSTDIEMNNKTYTPDINIPRNKATLIRKNNAIRRHVSESMVPPVPPPRELLELSNRRRNASGEGIRR